MVETQPTFGVSSCIGPDRTDATAADGAGLAAGGLGDSVVRLVDAAGTVGAGALHPIRNAETSVTIGREWG